MKPILGTTPFSKNYPLHQPHPHSLPRLQSKLNKKFPVPNLNMDQYMCRSNCVYHAYLLQAHVRKNFLQVTMNSLKTLVEIESITNGIPISVAVWGPFDCESARTRIMLISRYVLQAENDILTCENTLKSGCQGCFP